MSSKNQKSQNRTYDLADRLVKFNSMVGKMAESMVTTKEGTNIKNQLIRCSTSAALNYGEALCPESTADFIHKISICLKELMETYSLKNNNQPGSQYAVPLELEMEFIRAIKI